MSNQQSAQAMTEDGDDDDDPPARGNGNSGNDAGDPRPVVRRNLPNRQ